MRNTYSTNLNLKHVDIGLLIFRIGISGLMLTHGVPKLISAFSGEEIRFADPLGMGVLVTFTFAVFAEFICSVLIILGLGTRLAAIPLIITMGVAAFIVHLDDGFGTQELPLLYFVSFILLFFTGGGKYSLDWYFLARKKNN